MRTVNFTDDHGNEAEFYVEEQTRVGGTDYLLVSDRPEGDANALILKDISGEDSEEAEYVPGEDEEELRALMKLFGEMLEDTDLTM